MMKTVRSELPSVWNHPVGGTLRKRNFRTSVGKPVRYSTQSSAWRANCLGSGAGIGMRLLGLRHGTVVVGHVRVEDVGDEARPRGRDRLPGHLDREVAELAVYELHRPALGDPELVGVLDLPLEAIEGPDRRTGRAATLLVVLAAVARARETDALSDGHRAAQVHAAVREDDEHRVGREP